MYCTSINRTIRQSSQEREVDSAHTIKWESSSKRSACPNDPAYGWGRLQDAVDDIRQATNARTSIPDLPRVGDEQICAFEVTVYYLFAVHVSHLRRGKRIADKNSGGHIYGMSGAQEKAHLSTHKKKEGSETNTHHPSINVADGCSSIEGKN